MVDDGQPPPGGGAISCDQTEHHSSPSIQGGLPATSVWAGGRSTSSEPSKMRSFEQILAEANDSRNILEIHLKKIIPDNEPRTKPANITHDQLG